MRLETERLEIIPLKAPEARLWLEDLSKIEEKFNCVYKADALEGIFRDIVKNQVEITEKDSEHYFYHTFWFIIRKSDRVVVGTSDFKDVPNENHEVEIGYGLEKEFEHNGYMTETVQAMCEWAFKQKEIKSVIAETLKENIASQNVLKRCGFEKYMEKENLWWKLTK